MAHRKENFTPLTDISVDPKRARGRMHSLRLSLGRNVISSVLVDLERRTVERYEWDRQYMYAYQGYAVLWGERIHANPPKEQRQTVSFLDLPGEIRNRIYMLSLNFGAIELTAKTAGDTTATRRARRFHLRRYIREVKPALRFLRVNKQINMEAASIFYGENEFRFTGRCGHDVLLAFCKTIGLANTRRLAKITEHAPFEGHHDTWDRPANDSANCQQNFNEWVARQGLHKRGSSSGRFTVGREIAGRHGSLRDCKMVIPFTFAMSDTRFSNRLSHLCDRAEAKKEREANGQDAVRISLVVLDGWSSCDQTTSDQAVLRSESKDLARRCGWEVIEAYTLKHGGYEYPMPPLTKEDSLVEQGLMID